MTAPGYVPPPATGWWVKRNRVLFTRAAQLRLTPYPVGIVPENILTPTKASLQLTKKAVGVTQVAPVQYISSGSSATSSVTIPTHQVGDVIVIFAYRNTSTTTPTKPSAGGTVPAWVDITNNTGGNANSSRTAYFTATATNTTSGTWTQATNMIAVVVRNAKASPIGGQADTTGTSTVQATAPSVTLSATDGTSVLLHFLGVVNAVTWDAAPSGYTQQFSDTKMVLLTKDVTTTDGSVQNTHPSSSVAYCGQTVEILQGP